MFGKEAFMKYKALLLGANKAIIETFFIQMDDTFECLSSSMRFVDIAAHIQYFNPDIIVYCLYDETKDDMSRMTAIKQKLCKEKIPIAIVGEPEDCEKFQKTAIHIANIIIQKPISPSGIQDKILSFLQQKDSVYLNSEQNESEETENVQAPHSSTFQAEYPTEKCILVVDDDPLMLRVLKRHLDKDYIVAAAISGKVAFKFLEKRIVDLILLDYEMPDEKGPEVLEKLRQDKQFKDIPVIFLTGVDSQTKVQKALEMKPQGYLLKPIDKEKLLHTIKEIIG